jgi:hypothetical protein
MGMYDTETRNSMMSGYCKNYEAVDTLVFTDINLSCLGGLAAKCRTTVEKAVVAACITISEYGM